MSLKSPLIIFLLLVLSGIIYSQQRQGFAGGTITGKVFDKSSGHTIEYANIVSPVKNRLIYNNRNHF